MDEILYACPYMTKMDETAHCMQAKIEHAGSFYLTRWLWNMSPRSFKIAQTGHTEANLTCNRSAISGLEEKVCSLSFCSLRVMQMTAPKNLWHEIRASYGRTSNASRWTTWASPRYLLTWRSHYNFLDWDFSFSFFPSKTYFVTKWKQSPYGLRLTGVNRIT